MARVVASETSETLFWRVLLSRLAGTAVSNLEEPSDCRRSAWLEALSRPFSSLASRTGSDRSLNLRSYTSQHEFTTLYDISLNIEADRKCPGTLLVRTNSIEKARIELGELARTILGPEAIQHQMHRTRTHIT